MLARSFMSHTDLGITEEEHSALVKVLGMLERGELCLVVHDDTSIPNGFNMGTQILKSACGTVACIGGWCGIYMGLDSESAVFAYVDSYSDEGALHQLYWGTLSSWVDTAQAARALSNYLTTGEPDWKSVLENSHD